MFLRDNPNRRGSRDPDLTGTWQTAEGGEFWASAWWNDDKNGQRYLRIIQGREKEPRDTAQHPAEKAPIANAKPLTPSYRPNRSTGAPPTVEAVAMAFLSRGTQPPMEILQLMAEGKGNHPYTAQPHPVQPHQLTPGPDDDIPF